MPAGVSPADRIRAKIDALFAEDRELPEILEEVSRLGAQLLMQAALEAEVTEFLGRERYQRTATCPDATPGSRAVSLVWAVLDRASQGWRGVTMATTDVRLLQDLRRSLHEPPRPLHPTANNSSGVEHGAASASA